MTWIQTWKGKAVDLLDPRPEQICIEDIAHALARICRYTGHTDEHYSVAQHSVLVAEHVPEDIRLAALLHDAAEAYVQDVSRPLKQALRIVSDRMNTPSAYDLIESQISDAIALKFGVSFDDSRLACADIRMLATEARDLGFLEKAPCPWGLTAEPYPEPIIPRSAENAEGVYLAAYDRAIKK